MKVYLMLEFQVFSFYSVLVVKKESKFQLVFGFELNGKGPKPSQAEGFITK